MSTSRNSKTPTSKQVLPVTPRRAEALRKQLDDLYFLHHRPENLSGDPLLFAHRYRDPLDQELVALLAAIFASGNIKAINAFLGELLLRLGDRPALAVAERKNECWRGCFDGLGHRWVRPPDLEVLFALLGDTLRRHGSLQRLFLTAYDPQAETLRTAHQTFVDGILAADCAPLVSRNRPVHRHDGRICQLAPIPSILLTSPVGGSACKRMNLFFRWVVRPADGIDLGLWSAAVSPRQLSLPVDVHVLRYAQNQRLTKRTVPDGLAVAEVTAAFRCINAEDPCRYDFAIVREGIATLARNRQRRV